MKLDHLEREKGRKGSGSRERERGGERPGIRGVGKGEREKGFSPRVLLRASSNTEQRSCNATSASTFISLHPSASHEKMLRTSTLLPEAEYA